MSHFSWKDQNTDYESLMKRLENLKLMQHVYENSDKKTFALCYDNNIPIYQYNQEILSHSEVQQDVYQSFHDEFGCVVLRNVYDKKTMDEYNDWCLKWLENNDLDMNGTHPKQKDKYLINDIVGRLPEENPELFMKLMANPILCQTLDVLLGFAKIGSATCHWIQPKGDRQLSHVDYPIHIGSGKFWEGNVDKCKRLMTRKQINVIMKHYSCQVIIATDAMDVSNGSTEIIPCSHLLPDLDINIHNKEYYDMMEPHFVNAKLSQGDILIFNRGICHRGGKNLSDNRRNSLILQCVNLWGIGQEVIDYDKLYTNIKDSNEYKYMTETEKEEFLLRFKFPYPLNVKLNA